MYTSSTSELSGGARINIFEFIDHLYCSSEHGHVVARMPKTVRKMDVFHGFWGVFCQESEEL